MPASNFLKFTAAAAVLHAAVYPEWYTSLQTALAIAAVVVYEYLSPRAGALPSKEIDELRAQVGELQTQVKSVNNKVTGIKMSIGLKD